MISRVQNEKGYVLCGRKLSFHVQYKTWSVCSSHQLYSYYLPEGRQCDENNIQKQIYLPQSALLHAIASTHKMLANQSLQEVELFRTILNPLRGLNSESHLRDSIQNPPADSIQFFVEKFQFLYNHSLLYSIDSQPHADCRGKPFSDCPSVDFDSKFHPKVACMSLIDLRKELAVCCSSVGIGRPLRKQNRIRQSPTPVPSMYRQYSSPNASQNNLQLILNFVPSAPICPHVASLPIAYRRSKMCLHYFTAMGRVSGKTPTTASWW